jgi:hypothetical protein
MGGLRATGSGGVVEAFACVHFASGHLTVLDGECVKLRE